MHNCQQRKRNFNENVKERNTIMIKKSIKVQTDKVRYVKKAIKVQKDKVR